MGCLLPPDLGSLVRQGENEESAPAVFVELRQGIKPGARRRFVKDERKKSRSGVSQVTDCVGVHESKQVNSAYPEAETRIRNIAAVALRNNHDTGPFSPLTRILCGRRRHFLFFGAGTITETGSSGLDWPRSLARNQCGFRAGEISGLTGAPRHVTGRQGLPRVILGCYESRR